MKPITGQYECVHRSGVGLDYFTSRIDRLTLHPNGRFIIITQDHSRLANAAQSLLSGQQINTAAPETRNEGSYNVQGNTIFLRFNDGKQEQAQLSWNGEGLQIGQSFYNKVSDSTILPPTHRMQKDMDDIAKGLKIATSIGGMAFKAAKTIHETFQTPQTAEPGLAGQPPTPQPAQPQAMPPMQGQQIPMQPPTPAPQPQPMPAQPVPPAATPQAPRPVPTPSGQAIFCDQCGERCRPGKRFCGHCGAQLW
ncbi:zinc ribbon domain-containing protein [Ktedonosporobacter rubrisoli]|uniref:Zinc ribbon domain-containing protein n=1 Tax=Ktedonosporobacter rubrisoli TaxID=2509675 RepID=A0A4P6K3G4_KTERU|nr:zinc ribbon domain-containing protein [Ktedonosporobacter rubrisoli]QBD82729.1 zinc ribbon domain-containing protein [Ktedonosporobacter rubrisoli]